MAIDPVLDLLVRWAESRTDVRTVILTSTRAVPGAKVDAYSDYDVVVVVDHVSPLVEDASWLSDFGEVLIAYWDPLTSDPVTGFERVGSVVNYVDGLKIDFGLWSRQAYAEVALGPEPDAELDAGFTVLVDKDDLTAGLPSPTYRAYVPERPDETAYLRLITDFLIGVPYVAKGLLRGELLPARWVLDVDLRFNYLVPLLEWRVECDHGWTWKPGALSKGLQRHLPVELWTELEHTFVGADPEVTWEALFAMVALFGRVAEEVAQSLGHRYSGELVARVTAHAQRMRAGDFAGGRLT